VEGSQRSVKKKKFDIDDPELKKILNSPEQSKKIQSIFFNYDKGPPRILTNIEVFLEE